MREYIEAQIVQLEARLTYLAEQRVLCVNEKTLQSGRSADNLRENWHAEENRREGLRAIDGSIDGAQEQLAFYRRQLATI